ncbi:hypothetical protein M2347_001523 [Chryseobacterium sp. H1D6B]|uniref:leucine-rich repeat domain-containing protein n=1 Tax=Chryseobacterium sp. H1D6B TaxID=2940588 RepID=UPI0015C97BF3|nr:leucine-rich repeat domain-containing protein [Chryseobacterium sp. H1D6B]MDH6251796.1 hypothetical protein [Chryseobacterium sp. H1D6B]
MKTKEELRLYFENGDRPVQENFWDWQESYWHKEEKIPQDSVESYESVIPLFFEDKLKGSAISLTLPKNTKKIAAEAYLYTGLSYQIVQVIFNEGLEEIGSSAFNSQNIKIIQTPTTLKTIGGNAFSFQADSNNGLDSLQQIILNEGLLTIGDNAFNCPRATAVKNLYIPFSVQSVGQDAFAIPSLTTVFTPKGLDLSRAGIPKTARIVFRNNGNDNGNSSDS